MSYTRKVAYNTAAQMIGKVVATGLSLVTMAALFRYLGIEGVGKYTTVFAFVAFFAIFADFGIQWTLIRELTVNPDHDKVFKNIFALRIILAFIIHAVSFGVVWFFKYPIDVKLGVGVINLAWFFTTINSALVSVFLNNYRLDISVMAESVGRAVILAMVLLLTKMGASFNMVLTAYIFGNTINFIIDYFYVRRFVSFGLAFDFKYWKVVFDQALPIGIVLVFGFIYYKVDSLMLSILKPMTDVGIYGTAYKLLEVLQTVPSMFLGAAFPLITKYVTEKDDRAKGAFQKQVDFLILMAVPVVFGTFILASPIIQLIAGSKGTEFISASTVTFLGNPVTSVTCLKILIFSVGISFFSQLYHYTVISLGQQKKMVWPTIGFATFNVALNLFLIPRYSYLGAAFSTLLTEILVCSTFYHLTNKLFYFPVKLNNAFKIFLAGLVMAFVTYILNKIGINLWAIIVFVALLYALLVLLFKAVPLSMVKGLVKR